MMPSYQLVTPVGVLITAKAYDPALDNIMLIWYNTYIKKEDGIMTSSNSMFNHIVMSGWAGRTVFVILLGLICRG